MALRLAPKNFAGAALGIILILVIVAICISYYVAGWNSNIVAPPQRDVLKSLQTNLLAGPITDLRFENGGCNEQGYSQISLGVFSGLRLGCVCPNNPVPLVGTCVANNQPKCSNQDLFAPKELTRWIKSYTLCAARATDLVYLTNGTTTCGQGWKSCSSNTCVKESSKCPLVDFKLIKTDDPLPAGYFEIQAKAYDIDNGQAGSADVKYKTVGLAGFKDTTLTFIKGLTIDLTGQPCVNPMTRPLRQGTQYPLEFIPASGCDQYGVDTANSVILNTAGEDAILKSNSLFPELPEHYKQYIQEKKDNVNLNIRKAIPLTGYTATCVNYQPFNAASQWNSDLQRLPTLHQNYFIPFVIFLTIAIFSVIFIFLKPDHSGVRLVGIVAGLFIIFACLTWIVQFIHFQSAYSSAQSSQSKFNTNCIKDDNYKLAINQVNSSGGNVQSTFNTATNWEFAFGLICLLITIVIILLFRQKRVEQDEWNLQRNEDNYEMGQTGDDNQKYNSGYDDYNYSGNPNPYIA